MVNMQPRFLLPRTMNATEPTTSTLFSARSESEGLQVDALSSEPLLISLEMGGSNWPSSCRNGTCRTCLGKLHRGEVRYEMDWPGLSAEEKSEGYLLPCVAFPCSDVALSQGY